MEQLKQLVSESLLFEDNDVEFLPGDDAKTKPELVNFCAPLFIRDIVSKNNNHSSITAGRTQTPKTKNT